MKFTKNTILIATAMLFVLTGCKKEQGCKDPLATNYNADAEEDDGSCTYPAPYTVPTTYVFTDDNNNSTVSYSGQTDRMNMLSEMVSYLKTANGPDESGTNATLDAQKLKDMYSNSGTPGFTGTGVGSSGKDLKSKTANSSTIQAQFETWMDSAAAGSGGTVTGYLQGADGREWTQLIEKGLMGACFAFQITENYLTDNKIGTNVNNTDAVCFEMDEFFSTMEHHWDEAYGYFTDAIDYPTSGTDRFWGKYANKSYMNGLGEEIVSAFIKGRAAISASRHQEGDGLLYHSDVLTQRDIIVSKVNRMAAGMAIHYLLDTKTAVSGGENQNSINHSMSEAYAFMYGLHTLNGGIWATEIASMLAAIDTDFVGYTADNTKIDADIAAIAALAGISDPDSFQ
jgi:hypothetical protein